MNDDEWVAQRTQALKNRERLGWAYYQTQNSNGVKKQRTCGTISAYRAGCRCDDCREVNAVRARRYRERRRAS